MKKTSQILCLVATFIFGTARGQMPSDKLLELYNIINMSYVDTFNYEQLNEAAINAMLEHLDPHSIYIPQKQVQAMNENLNGKYEGIGIQFDMYRDTVLVVTPITGGPSHQKGVLAGDKIIRADNELLSGVGKSDEEIIEKLRGEQGSQVKIGVLRPHQKDELEFEITRDKIPIHSVDVGYMLNEKTGYIKINRFSRSTLTEFHAEIKSLKDDGMENLVLDLRGNGGGYLYSAVELVDQFIDGKKTIVSTVGLRQTNHEYKSKPRGAFTEGNLIVLINEGSASASEIVAGAVQDLDRGVIVGRRSFGKGLVMKPYSLSDGSVVRLTTSRYYTPSGRCIQKDYNGSKDDYDSEIRNRLDRGELLYLDSMDIPDSLSFKTSKGRTVYGGGGIIPDIFVPADSVILEADFQEIFKSGIFITSSMDFAQLHRDDLSSKYKNVEEWMNDTSYDQEIIDGMNQQILSSGVLDNELNKIQEEKALSQSKAYISRYIWGERAYHIGINKNQRVIEVSLNLLEGNDFDWDQLSYYSK